MSAPLLYHTRRILDLQSFLGLFKNVRRVGGNSQGIDNYSAYCPAHDTRHASLSIGVTRDGRYLVHCYAGCDAHAIMAAVGLTLADLYPDGALTSNGFQGIEHSKSSSYYATVLEIAKADRNSGRRLSEEEKRLERTAFLELKRDHQWPRREDVS